MNDAVEQFLQASIFPEMERGRPNWDVPHTEAVVKHIKAIIAANPQLLLDRDILVIAAYAHDWGYADLFKAGKLASFAEVLDQKAAHMDVGARKIGALLTNAVFDFLTPDQKERIVHLVQVHDKRHELHDNDELVLLEADTLGMTDPAVTPTYTLEEYRDWRHYTETGRMTHFITDYSKHMMAELLEQREQYYMQLKNQQ